MIPDTILSSLITGGLALVGVYFSNRKSAALIEFRIQQLEKKQDVHNQTIERTYKLEERTELQEAELRRHEERIKNLEANNK